MSSQPGTAASNICTVTLAEDGGFASRLPVGVSITGMINTPRKRALGAARCKQKDSGEAALQLNVYTRSRFSYASS